MVNETSLAATQNLGNLANLRARMADVFTAFRSTPAEPVHYTRKRPSDAALEATSDLDHLAAARTKMSASSERVYVVPAISERLPTPPDEILSVTDAAFFGKIRLLSNLLVGLDERSQTECVSALDWLNLEEVFSMRIHGVQQVVQLLVEKNMIFAHPNQGEPVVIGGNITTEENFLIFAPEIFDQLVAFAVDADKMQKNLYETEFQRQRKRLNRRAWEGGIRVNMANIAEQVPTIPTADMVTHSRKLTASNAYRQISAYSSDEKIVSEILTPLDFFSWLIEEVGKINRAQRSGSKIEILIRLDSAGDSNNPLIKIFFKNLLSNSRFSRSVRDVFASTFGADRYVVLSGGGATAFEILKFLEQRGARLVTDVESSRRLSEAGLSVNLLVDSTYLVEFGVLIGIFDSKYSTDQKDRVLTFNFKLLPAVT